MDPHTNQPNRLDFSSLHQPITKNDLEAYKAWVGRSSFGNGWLIYAIALTLGVPLVLTTFFLLKMTSLGLLFSTMLACLVIVGIVASVYFGTKFYNQKKARLYKFAQQNNLTLLSRKPEPAYKGMIFDEGDTRMIESAFRFPEGLEIGNYKYVTGSRDSRTTHMWGYVKLSLSRQLPHMILDSNKNNFLGISNLSDTFDRSQKLSLEGDFDKYYTLYVPHTYERDALYVFTPDVMARLIEAGGGHDMEIIDNELFIYRSGSFNLTSETELQSVLKIVDALKTELTKQTSSYHDERIGDRRQDSIAAPGQRLKKGFSVTIVLIVIGVFGVQITSSIWPAVGIVGWGLLWLFIVGAIFYVLFKRLRTGFSNK